jgi:hypothetical protein
VFRSIKKIERATIACETSQAIVFRVVSRFRVGDDDVDVGDNMISAMYGRCCCTNNFLGGGASDETRIESAVVAILLLSSSARHRSHNCGMPSKVSEKLVARLQRDRLPRS